ncbi:hypothetical protein O6H91_18G037400 [Diphasiastrum complanatum]|uniref:Uncharacterized protein n=1 Tax=Diphasiastrum complanatum TaxID=34168 RepID=A0ACC2B039_DIPCM|nr:hypothetical protein O6H91_18G037400 [Diphasiastrum complanatum]
MGCASSKQIAAQVALESPRDNVDFVKQLSWSNALTKVDTIDILKEFREQEQEKEKEKEQKEEEKDQKEDKEKEKEKEKEEETEKQKDEQEQQPNIKITEHANAVDSKIREETEKGRTASPPVQDEAKARLSNPVKHLEGEQVAAGWPSWLSAVAGEAIKGWIPRRADSFEKLHKIGQGTYSNVYKARDLETGTIVALKKVRFDNFEPESVRFMAREIQILRRLDHPNIVKLEGIVTSRMSCSLYLIFEYMEHDLAGLAACPGITFTEAQVKCYLQQLLRGLDHCHSQNVLHRDVKGSNLLLDNGGNLKIADFGLATICHAAQKQAMTSRVVTLWYRPPELLLGATDYGTAIDLWSTGCILAELFAGRPIMPGRTEVEQLHKIFRLCGSPSEEYWKRSKLPDATIFKPHQPYKRRLSDTFKNFPASSVHLLEKLLAIEPAERGTAAEALQSEFFTTKPLACDPSSLRQYPPSKEFDAKLRAEGARRQKAAVGNLEAGRRQGTKDVSSKGLSALDSNTELPATFQRIQSQLGKNKAERLLAPDEDTAIEIPSKSYKAGYSVHKSRGKSTGSGKGQPVFPDASSRSEPVAGPGWKRQKEDEIRPIPSRSIARATKVVSTLEGNPVRRFGAEASYLASRQIVSGISYREKEELKHLTQEGKKEASGGSTTKKYRSESFLKSAPQWPEAFSKQDKALKSLKVADIYRHMESQKDGGMRGGRASFQEAHGFQRQAGSIYHSDPRLLAGTGAAVDADELSDERARKTQRAARRALRERSQLSSAPSSAYYSLVDRSHPTKTWHRAADTVVKSLAAESSQDRR